MRKAILILFFLAALLGGQAVRAGDQAGQRRVFAKLKVPVSKRAPKPAKTASAESGVDQLFDELESIESPELEEHKAGDLSNSEVVIVVIFLIIFFPLGLILLVIFLLDDED